MKKKTKIILGTIGFLTLIILGYYFIIEKENIEIDEYNFEQLKIVDEIIMNDTKYDIGFRNIWAFNSNYNTNIKPIKNCYYINKYNGNEKYLFGFKLESLLYRVKYMNTYIAYPKYDLPKKIINIGHLGKKGQESSDINLKKFIEHISKPCDDEYLGK